MENPDIEKIKARLARLEEAVFGMTYDEAETIVNSYIAASRENPSVIASKAVLTAEKVLGV